MDYLLLIFILTIVICMGYILSKPFTSQSDTQKVDDHEVDLDPEYQLLLQDIKNIERYYQAGIITEEDCMAKISEKKAMAADLLRKSHTQNESEQINSQASVTPETTRDQPKEALLPQGSIFCPKCGDWVLTSDKFCVHCGHRLQP